MPVDTEEHKDIIFCVISVLILWGNRGGALLYLSSAFRVFVLLACLLKRVERDSPPHCQWGCFPKSVSRNGPLAMPVQLGEWSSVTWSSMRKLFVCHGLPSVLIISGYLEVEADVTHALQVGTGRCDLSCAVLMS